ncbi:unnamed protein product [Arctogadus glacialis]
MENGLLCCLPSLITSQSSWYHGKHIQKASSLLKPNTNNINNKHMPKDSHSPMFYMGYIFNCFRSRPFQPRSMSCIPYSPLNNTLAGFSSVPASLAAVSTFSIKIFNKDSTTLWVKLTLSAQCEMEFD